MTRRMADSVNVADLPDGFDMYGAYDDGLYNNAAACKARFPDKPIVIFTVFPQDEIGDCLDVENGDATPQQAPAWVIRRRLAGHPAPLVYCSESAWTEVRNQFDRQNVYEPGYIIAAYPGSAGEHKLYPPPCVGHQFKDWGPYDESVLVDYLPGIDPPPPPPVPPKESHMPVSALITFKPGQQDGFQVTKGFLLHKWLQAGDKWYSECIAGPWGGVAGPPPGIVVSFPDQTPQVSVIDGNCELLVEDSNGKVWFFQQTESGSTWGVNEIP